MFRKKIQSLFKFFIQKFFILIYGKISVFNSTKKNEDQVIKITGINSDNNPEIVYFLYKIKNGRIYTDTNQNVAVINKDNLISVSSFQHINNKLRDVSFNSVLIKGTPRFKKKFKGKIFNLAQGGSGNNYFHFIFDIVSKIYLLQKNLDINTIDYFYVPKITNWQKKIYSLFFISEEKLIDSEKFRHVESDMIISVSHPWYFKGEVHDETSNIPDWIIEHNRNKFLPIAKKFNNNKKIFLDRSSSKYNHCQIINNEQIKKFFKEKGFTSYKVEELDFKEQIYLFKEASVIVGAHGAAFTNIIFCKERTKILEIIPESHPSKQNERISKILNLNYYKIITKDTYKKDFPYSIYLDDGNFKKISETIDLY